jgi:hypothetical protein
LFFKVLLPWETTVLLLGAANIANYSETSKEKERKLHFYLVVPLFFRTFGFAYKDIGK